MPCKRRVATNGAARMLCVFRPDSGEWGEGVSYVPLYSSGAPGDSELADGSTFQNSSNIGFYEAAMDTDPDTPGIQPYAFGDGTFNVRLTAYDAATGLYVAHNEVVVIVGDGIPGG